MKVRAQDLRVGDILKGPKLEVVVEISREERAAFTTLFGESIIGRRYFYKFDEIVEIEDVR